jgi:formylglycine-generating enzyme required for sulfatase activity
MENEYPNTFRKGENYPVEGVKLEEVDSFIWKLNKRTGKKYSLPTEAQWEYACRGGGKNVKYAGTSSGTELASYAWYDNNSGLTTHPAGEKRPNELGIYDMSGNVFEWVIDAYNEDAYTKHSESNPVWEGDVEKVGVYHVLRGGSWIFNQQSMRCSYRYNRDRADRHFYIGFRLVL